MTKLWRSLIGRGEERADRPLSMQQWGDMYDSMFSFGGSAYPIVGGYGSSTTESESLPNDFSGYVNGAYKANGIVFAVMLTRMLVFSEARFMYQKLQNGRPGDLFSTRELALLETPWPNGTTGELLSRAIQDTDLAGNHYVAREAGRVRRLRPDWVTIILTAPPELAVASDVAGYMYQPGGARSQVEPKFYDVSEVAHWSPIPDPEAQYRGMSWLTPIMREIESDKAATAHKQMYFKNAATPNIAVSLRDGLTKRQFEEFKKQMDQNHGGLSNAYKTLYLGQGADITVLGGDMRQMDFKSVQGAIETRIAAAGRVHPVLVGLSEGLQGSSLNSGNFTTARDWFGSNTMRPLWRSIAASYQTLVPRKPGARLWYDDRDIPALRADKKDLAEIEQIAAATINQYITAGFEPASAVACVQNDGDKSLLKHSGLVSVQLIPPGQQGNDPGADTNGDNTTPADSPPAKPDANSGDNNGSGSK